MAVGLLSTRATDSDTVLQPLEADRSTSRRDGGYDVHEVQARFRPGV